MAKREPAPDYSDTAIPPVKVLVVDDEIVRLPTIIEWLNNQFAQQDAIPRKLDIRYEAVPNASFWQFDFVFLDHDLAGIDLYEHLRQEYPEKRYHQETTAIIHSMNPVGARNLQVEMEWRGYTVRVIPYSQM